VRSRRHLPRVAVQTLMGTWVSQAAVHRRLRQAHPGGVRFWEKSVMRDAIRAKSLSAFAALRPGLRRPAGHDTRRRMAHEVLDRCVPRCKP